MGDCCMWRRREWGTMAAVVGNLRHNMSTDVVSCCGPWRRAFEPLSQQRPHQSSCFFTSANSRHHGGMMRNGSVGTEDRIGAGGEVFCLMRFLASIGHSGHHGPMAAMRPYSRLLSIQQSTKHILCNMLVTLKLEKVIINNVY
jgi:hypothetical protein